MDGVTEKIVGILVGAIASGVVSYIIAGGRARIVSAEEAGRAKAEIEHLKIKLDAQNEVIHERVSKMSTELSATLEKLDTRTITILENHAELRGILLGRQEGR